MPLIRYLWYLFGQVLGYTVATRRPIALLVIVMGGLVAVVGAALHLVAPVAIYPFL